MKKLFALMLCVAMLFSVCLAENARLVVRNVQASLDGETVVDLSGLEIEMSVVSHDDQGGFQLALTQNGQVIGDLVLAMADGAMTLDSVALSNVYMLPVGASVQMNEDALEDYAESLLGAEGETIERILEDSERDAGEVQYEGESYEATEISLSEAQGAQIVDAAVSILKKYSMILAQAGVNDVEGMVKRQEPKLSASGRVLENDHAEIVDLTLNLDLNALQDTATFEIHAEDRETGDDQGVASLALTARALGQEARFAADFEYGESGLDWLKPASKASVNATAMDQAQLEKLQSEMVSLLMRVASNVMIVNQQNVAMASQG